jgi:hypothetical protein
MEFEIDAEEAWLEDLDESTADKRTNELEGIEDVGGTIPSIFELLELLSSRLFWRLSSSNLTVCLKSS